MVCVYITLSAGQVKHIFHGTTIATNAILENKGSPVGLLVSEGFRFVLEIARHGTPRLVNPNSWIKPDRPGIGFELNMDLLARYRVG